MAEQLKFNNKKPDILVVDDEPINLSVLINTLSSLGYGVRIATDGEAALKSVDKKLPDLILLDIIMPGMDGYEVCRKLKADKKSERIPVLFVSVIDTAEDKVKAFNQGAADYINKPFQVDELIARVNTHLHLQQLRQEIELQNAELQRAKEAAEVANRAKSDFLANMSHALRTPLNAMLGFTQLLQSSETTPETQQEYLRIIDRSGQHLLALIDSVLDMARIEAGQTVLSPIPFDLIELTNEVVELIQRRAAGKGLLLFSEQPEQFYRFVRADATKLRQILINLLSNAVKYTQEGSVTLRLSEQAGEDDTLEDLIIEVEDTGIGIAEQDLEYIFEPFVQLDDSGRRSGTGLGLSITKQYVELMGGTVELTSEPGKGTLFRVSLPIEKSREKVVYRALHMSTHPHRLQPGQPEWRILIAENNPDNRLLLNRLLSSAGFAVRDAADGNEAISIFKEWRPHLIWMDSRMPVVDGLEATRRIRALPGGDETIIVALTASVITEHEVKAMVAGSDDFMAKPYRTDEVFDRISRHLGAHYETNGEVKREETEKRPGITPERVAKLPAEMRHEFYSAVIELDIAECRRLVSSIRKFDPELSIDIEGLVNQFNFGILRKLFEPR